MPILDAMWVLQFCVVVVVFVLKFLLGKYQHSVAILAMCQLFWVDKAMNGERAVTVYDHIGT